MECFLLLTLVRNFFLESVDSQTTERECLAIVFALQRFRNYLYGKEFVLYTDHMPLSFLDSMKHTNNRVLRWSLFIQNYRYRVVYVKGSQNATADYLSRSCKD